MADSDPIARLRMRRETFVVALTQGISMQDAQAVLAARRWAEADRRLAARHGQRHPITPDLTSDDDNSEASLPWWHR